MSTGERPPTDLSWYVDRLRILSPTMRVEPSAIALFSEQVAYDDHGLPRTVGKLTSLDDYRPRFAELLSRKWSWINLHAVGLLNEALVISVELPHAAHGNSSFTSVNLSGPTRAVAERSYQLGDLLEQ